jgi:centrosomal protein CEP104
MEAIAARMQRVLRNECTGAAVKDGEGVEEVAGEYVARAAFSRQWQLRDAALTYLVARCKDGSVSTYH